jgi:glycosyltransferase 2 family protein
MISLFVFFAFFALRGDPDAPGWMMPTAYAALGIFAAALVFVVFAMKKPEATVRFCITISLLPRFAPRLAKVIEEKLLDMIRGFGVLRDTRNMIKFTLWTAVYWSANGMTVWVLARGFSMIDPSFDLSLIGGFAVMGLVGVGISLPNAPGLVGQFQAFTLLGLSLYLGPAVLTHGSLYPVALAFAIVHHLFQVIWYVGMGAIGLASPWVSINDLRHVRDKPSEPEPET